MKADNEMKLEFLSKSQNESFARSVVAAFVAQLDPTIEELAEIKTAVSEAVTNAIIHGYSCEIGNVVIVSRIFGIDLLDSKAFKLRLYSERSLHSEYSRFLLPILEWFLFQIGIL